MLGAPSAAGGNAAGGNAAASVPLIEPLRLDDDSDSTPFRDESSGTQSNTRQKSRRQQQLHIIIIAN